VLAALQADSQASLAQLADRVGLSSSACHRRMRALEETGTITGYGARVDPARVGLNLHALIDITLESQSREAMERFEEATLASPDILECSLMSGSADTACASPPTTWPISTGFTANACRNCPESA
jgi:DNA-binding Lrp family transcriptional regulator